MAVCYAAFAWLLVAACVCSDAHEAFGTQQRRSVVSSVDRVVTLLQEMKAQLQREAVADGEAYEKMSCWCDANEKMKSKSILDADSKISEFQAEVESKNAKDSELSTKIEHLKKELSAKKQALAKAIALREKEHVAFNTHEKDSVQSVTMLKNAISVLKRHNGGLLQLTPALRGSVGSVLRWVSLKHEEMLALGTDGLSLQHGAISSTALISLSTRSGNRQSSSKAATAAITASDAVLRAFDGGLAPPAAGALPVELAARVLASAASNAAVSPSAEPALTAASPSASSDAVFAQEPYFVDKKPAHLQPYVPQSNQIFAILKQMQEEFEANVAESQKAELQAQKSYTELKAASEEQIATATKLLDDLQAEHGVTVKDLADAKEDLETTRSNRGADVDFLSDLRLKCQDLDSQWQLRSKSRSEELKAVTDAVAILADDDARDMFHKQFGGSSIASFLQLGGARRSTGRTSAVAATAARGRASAVLLRAARHLAVAEAPFASALISGDLSDLTAAWRAREVKPHQQLAAMSVQVKLDAFVKVKQAIDVMVEGLKRQQEEEVQHKAVCNDELHDNEKHIFATKQEYGDLVDHISWLADTIEQLGTDVKSAREHIADLKVQLKKAGEAREAENADFQEDVMDQRTVQQILKKALARLQDVYKKGEKYALAQQGPAPPVHFQPYSQHAGASPVISLLETIINDSATVEAEILAAEQSSQEAYASFVRDTDASIKGLNASIENKEASMAGATKEKAETEASKASAGTRLEDLAAVAGDLHVECDFLLKNFDVRQRARLEEIDALQQAKASLSGMVDDA